MIAQLLDLAHPGDDPDIDIDLDEFLAEFGERIAAVLPQRIELRIERPQRPVVVKLPRAALDHSLLNLVLNAKDAIDNDGGSIHVAVRAAEEQAILEVRDTGEGIDPDLIGTIFEPYVTTKPRGQGTGLGLPAVRTVVQRALGKLSVESALGRGTTFRIALPLASAARSHGARRAAASSTAG